MARKRSEANVAPTQQSGPDTLAEQHAEPEHRTEGRKPARTFRIGRLWCNIWENHHPETGTWYSVSLTRSYRDKENQWQTSANLGKDDLLAAAELYRMAFHWINDSQRLDG